MNVGHPGGIVISTMLSSKSVSYITTTHSCSEQSLMPSRPSKMLVDGQMKLNEYMLFLP